MLVSVLNSDPFAICVVRVVSAAKDRKEPSQERGCWGGGEGLGLTDLRGDVSWNGEVYNSGLSFKL